MILGFPEDFGPLAAKQPHSIILPPHCFLVALVFSGLNAWLSCLHTYCWPLWLNDHTWVLSYPTVFLQKVFSLSMWSIVEFFRVFLEPQPVSPCRCKTRLTVYTDTCLPAASNSLCIRFFVFFLVPLLIVMTNFPSPVGDSLRLLPDGGSDMHFILTNSCLHSWTWEL